MVYAGGDQTVHGHALDTTLNGGYQYVHNGGTASDTVVNSDGWQIVKEGGLADFTTVNQKGKLQVNARWYSHECHPETGWSTGHQYCGNGSWQQPSGQFHGGKR